MTSGFNIWIRELVSGNFMVKRTQTTHGPSNCWMQYCGSDRGKESRTEKIRVIAGAMLREETEDLPRATQCAYPSDVDLAVVRRFGLGPVDNT